MDAARHQEVARAFGRGLGQDRRLDLVEALLVEVPAQRHRDAVPQADVVLQLRPAQVEIAVLQPRLFRDVLVLGDRERRRLGLVEDPHFASRALRPRRSAGPGSRSSAERRSTSPRTATTNSERRRLARSSRAASSITTCVRPWRSRTSRNSSDPRSRTRCTQPSRTTSVPTSPGEARHRCECVRGSRVVQPFPTIFDLMNARHGGAR